MKTAETKTVIIEQKDLQPLIDKAIAGVGGNSIHCTDFLGGVRTIYNPDGRESAKTETPIQIVLMINVEKGIK